MKAGIPIFEQQWRKADYGIKRRYRRVKTKWGNLLRVGYDRRLPMGQHGEPVANRAGFARRWRAWQGRRGGGGVGSLMIILLRANIGAESSMFCTFAAAGSWPRGMHVAVSSWRVSPLDLWRAARIIAYARNCIWRRGGAMALSLYARAPPGMSALAA